MATSSQAHATESCLRRLGNQLRVDFAKEICSTAEKRKRKPTYSIYTEAAEDTEEREFRSTMKRSLMDKKVKRSHQETPNCKVDPTILNAAISLAQLRASISPPVCEQTNLANKTIENMMKAYTEAIAAKDEAIKTFTAALAAKEELIRVQAMLIDLMQQHASKPQRAEEQQ